MLRVCISTMLMLVVALLAVPSTWADEPKKADADQIKWDTKDFENAIQTQFGLKMKSISLVLSEIKGKVSEPEKVKILLEFDKDADYALSEINRAFEYDRMTVNYAKRRTEAGGRLELLYYSEENVRIGKVSRGKVEGDFTGKQGEAFRVWVRPDTKVPPNVRRIEVRLHPLLDVQQDKKSTEISKAIEWDTTEFAKTLENGY